MSIGDGIMQRCICGVICAFFFRDRIVYYSAIVAVIFIVAQVLLLQLNIKPRSEPVSLHYTTYFGVDFIGAWYLLYLIPLLGFGLAILNLTLAFVFAKHDKLLSYILILTIIFALLLLTIHTALLIRINA